MSIHRNRYLQLLLRYLRPLRLNIFALSLLLLANILLQLLNPQIISFFIDTAQAARPLQPLLFAAALFLLTALLQRSIAFASTYLAESIGWTATNTLRAELALHCLRLDMPFHKTHSPGELIERIDEDVTLLANFFSQLLIQVLGNALLVLGILLFLFHTNWLIGLGLTLYTLLTFTILALLQNRTVPLWKAEREANAAHYAFLEEHIQGTEDIRSSGAEPYIIQHLFTLMRHMLLTTRHARIASNLMFISTNFLFILGYTLGLALGTLLYLQHQISLGTTYVIVYYIGMLATPLETVRKQFQDLQKATASIERIEELFATQPLVQESVRATLPTGPLALSLQNVTFSYEAQEPILHNLSFSLAPGQILGLLGRTGSGKSTLARLLLRLYDPNSGSIHLATTDLRELALDDLRTHVGMVTQDVQLFQATIRENLTFFDPHIDDEQILQALDALKLTPWLATLPAGLDSSLSASGQGLSAGEAQLLAFTRIFLKQPGLVVLDEASSRLDPATETRLEQAIDLLLAKRTAIIIAHRLQTVQRADYILILDHGHILEYGPRTTLAADPTSHFSRLLQTGLEEVLA